MNLLLCLLPLGAMAIMVGGRTSKNHCNDGVFLINKAHLVAREKAGKDACPAGYQLAKLETKAQFNRAAYFTFGCLGPSKEAWIDMAGENAVPIVPGSKAGIPLSNNDALKLVAPDAIEKGLLVEGRGNVRAYGQVTTEKATAKIPVLCQKKQ